jgi:hypothetical protein
VRSSADGVTWTNSGSLMIPNYFNARDFLVDKAGKFIAYGYSSIASVSNLITITSSNGTSWTQQNHLPSGLSSTMTFDINKLVIKNDGTYFISAYANDYTGPLYKWYVFKSSDGGVNWTEVTTASVTGSSSLQLGGLLLSADGYLYASYFESDGTTQSVKINRSLDGTTWSLVGNITLPTYFSYREFIQDKNGNLAIIGYMNITKRSFKYDDMGHV